jgi:hypothetical protein
MWTLHLPLSNQTTARRNAHRAAIECSIRRRQREDADRFLERREAGARPVIPAQARRS